MFFCIHCLGRSYFDRFAKEWTFLVNFKTKGAIFQIQQDPITIKDWTYERDNYTRIQRMTKYCASKKSIIVLKANEVELVGSNVVQIPVLVTFIGLYLP